MEDRFVIPYVPFAFCSMYGKTIQASGWSNVD